MSSKTGPEGAFTRRPWSLAARLTAWYAGSSFLLILSSTTFLYWVLFSNLDREDDQYVADKIERLRELLAKRPVDDPELRRELGEEGVHHAPRIFVRLLNEAGGVLSESQGMDRDLTPSSFPGAGPVLGQRGSVREMETEAGQSYRLASASLAAGEARCGARTLQLAFDRTYEEKLLAVYRRDLGMVLALALLLCAVAGFQIARRGLRPVAQIAQTMERIRSTTLSERIVPSGLPSELSALAVTFNEMLDRLEESFGRLARFSGDIAHELRTPVNNLRGEAEVALGRPRSPEEYREVLGSCLEECGRLSRLIDSMLFLARADSSASWITPQPVNIGRELEAIREFYQEVASEGGVTLVVAPGDTIMANADRTLFQRAIGNLVANALAHTPSGGRVTLAGTTVGQNVCVEVADTGSGIPAEDLPHIFEPFYRADRARSTFSGRVGLGLAIVSSIARLHRGSVTIDSQVGQGTRVRLVVPSGRSSPPCPVDS